MKKIIDLKVIKANTFLKKLIGLSFKLNKLNYCLSFKNCNSIHTIFMFQNIDVIMTDENNKVLYLKESLTPLKVILPKKNCTNTFELPVRTIKKYRVKIKDIIEFKSL